MVETVGSLTRETVGRLIVIVTSQVCDGTTIRTGRTVRSTPQIIEPELRRRAGIVVAWDVRCTGPGTPLTQRRTTGPGYNKATDQAWPLTTLHEFKARSGQREPAQTTPLENNAVTHGRGVRAGTVAVLSPRACDMQEWSREQLPVQ
ncbi:hypothetical protein PPGU19_090310 (plasmid) [Paraburkholderia sp. PGU19]|nr:hypothetical protein PPGU19_090310 [Paraburkholderia sp. PGU19]